MKDSFGSRLKALRKHFELNQEEISEKLGISWQAYLNYEKDRRKPNISLLEKLLSIFPVNLNWLIDGSGQMLNEIYLDESITNVAHFQELFYWMNKYQIVQFAVLACFEDIKLKHPDLFKDGS